MKYRNYLGGGGQILFIFPNKWSLLKKTTTLFRVPLTKCYFEQNLSKYLRLFEGQAGPEGYLGQKPCKNISFYWKNAVLANFEDKQ